MIDDLGVFNGCFAYMCVCHHMCAVTGSELRDQRGHEVLLSWSHSGCVQTTTRVNYHRVNYHRVNYHEGELP